MKQVDKQLTTLQYVLSAFIGFMFGLGLIPGFYDEVAPYIFIALIFQIIISVIRARILNIIIELILLILATLSLIPLLGYLFRFMGIILSIFEMVSFKHTKLYSRVETRTFHKKKKVKTSKRPKNFQEAEFSEK